MITLAKALNNAISKLGTRLTQISRCELATLSVLWQNVCFGRFDLQNQPVPAGCVRSSRFPTEGSANIWSGRLDRHAYPYEARFARCHLGVALWNRVAPPLSAILIGSRFDCF